MSAKADEAGADLDPHSIFDAELERIPARMRKFLVRKCTPPTPFEKTWENFGDAYGTAFEKLAETALANWSGGQLALPLFFLCRHSIELWIKAVITAYAESADELPRIEGHGLAQLWRDLIRQIQAVGFKVSDEYTIYCSKLVQHLHEVDPDGERFRYPTSRKGVAFDYTEINLTLLAVAHRHISIFCEGSIAMLGELGRQAG